MMILLRDLDGCRRREKATYTYVEEAPADFFVSLLLFRVMCAARYIDVAIYLTLPFLSFFLLAARRDAAELESSFLPSFRACGSTAMRDWER